MQFRKRERNVLAMHYQNSSRRFPFKFPVIIVTLISFWPHCEAQCSTPSANFAASTNPQLLYSLNYPNLYPEETRCSWLITSPIATGRIQLRVVHDNFSCCCDSDYLLIRDGSDPSAMPIAILCSELNPISITSSGPVIYGEFRSDADGQTGLGYTLHFNYFDSNAACPSDWIEREGYCYKLYDEAVPWQQAASRCGYDGGFLTSIVDEEENNFLVDSFENQSSVAWIGMDSAYNWLDGSESSLNFGNDSSRISMGCAVIDLDDGGRWRVEDCTYQSLNFICKKTRDGAGGRYWTEITISEEEEGSSGNFSGLIGVIIVGIIICISCRRRGNSNNNNGNCCGELITCICKGISGCKDAVGRAITSCLSCRCLGCASQSEEARTSGTTSSNPSAHQQEVSVVAVQISRRSSAASASPPAYGDISSDPPPPSYAEAFDARYDCGPTDDRESGVVMNIHEAIAAPSYESVVGSESNI